MIADGPLALASREQAARIIADLRLRRNGCELPIAGLPEQCRPRTLEDGYAIQESARPLIASGFGPPAGYKVGATAKVMQDRLGIPYPCSGPLFRGRLYRSGVTIARGDFRTLAVECEIGVLMATALPGVRQG